MISPYTCTTVLLLNIIEYNNICNVQLKVDLLIECLHFGAAMNRGKDLHGNKVSYSQS